MHLSPPQLLLRLCSFQAQFSPPRRDHIYACECTSMGCGCELGPCSFPHPSWALPTLLWLWVYVRVTSGAKNWGFQLAAIARVGEGRAWGQIRTGFPSRCAIWLLRSGMCFALLFWFFPSEVCEVSLAGQAMPRMAAPARGRRQEPGSCCLAPAHRDCHVWGTTKGGEPAVILLLGGFTPQSVSPVCVVIQVQHSASYSLPG